MAPKDNSTEDNEQSKDIVVVKKYANRRLYNTATSSYVTLDYLAEMVRRNEEFVVYDAKSGDDITRSVLTQIILEEENKGQSLLPVKFLRQLIGYYGGNMQSFVPSYLEHSMDSFRQNQETIRKSLSEAITDSPGFRIFEDVARQNMAMFENSMKAFGIDPNAMTANPFTQSAQNPGSGRALQEAIEEINRLQAELSSLKMQMAQSEE